MARHRIPFLSPPTTCRATVEVSEPICIWGFEYCFSLYVVLSWTD
jgi:hypothetical protein